MFLSHEELERYITRISLGKEFVFFEDKDKFITIKYPSLEVKQKASLIYDDSYKKAIDEGLLPLEKFEKLLISRGIFTKEDTDKLNSLKNKLEAQYILLSKTLKVRANQERIKGVIHKLQEEIDKIIYRKHSKLMMSAEAKADEVKNQYMCWASTFDDQGSLVWPTYDFFMQTPPSNFKNTILNTFISLLNGFETKIIRYIARSVLWRLRYSTSMKTSEVLFDIPTVEYSTDQLNLVYWSNFYDNIYNMMPDQKPSEDIIEDDDLLDKFMDEYYKDLKNETAIKRNNAVKQKGRLSAFDAEEVIVTQSNELYHDIKYDKPKEAQQIKNRVDIKKRTKSGK